MLERKRIGIEKKRGGRLFCFFVVFFHWILVGTSFWARFASLAHPHIHTHTDGDGDDHTFLPLSARALLVDYTTHSSSLPRARRIRIPCELLCLHLAV